MHFVGQSLDVLPQAGKLDIGTLIVEMIGQLVESSVHKWAARTLELLENVVAMFGLVLQLVRVSPNRLLVALGFPTSEL